MSLIPRAIAAIMLMTLVVLCLAGFAAAVNLLLSVVGL